MSWHAVVSEECKSIQEQIDIKNTVLLIMHEMALSELLDYYLHNHGLTAKQQHFVSLSYKSSELLWHEIWESSEQGEKYEFVKSQIKALYLSADRCTCETAGSNSRSSVAEENETTQTGGRNLLVFLLSLCFHRLHVQTSFKYLWAQTVRSRLPAAPAAVGSLILPKTINEIIYRPRAKQPLMLRFNP